MQTHDYLTSETVSKLTPEEYEKLRLYLKLMGYKIDADYGNYNENYNISGYNLVLDYEGDLSWWNDEYYNFDLNKEFTYDEIINLINLVPV